MSEELTEEKAREFIKKVFKGEVLDGWIEKSHVKALDEFEHSNPHVIEHLSKTLSAGKDDQQYTASLFRDVEMVNIVSLCVKEQGQEGFECHVREVADPTLYDEVKDALAKLGFEVKEVTLDLKE